jgi:hypothetical protein
MIAFPASPSGFLSERPYLALESLILIGGGLLSSLTIADKNKSFLTIVINRFFLCATSAMPLIDSLQVASIIAL